jgi:hypothetical protein
MPNMPKPMTQPIVPAPIQIPMLLWCPECGQRHVDEGEFATKPHHTHACQTARFAARITDALRRVRLGSGAG